MSSGLDGFYMLYQTSFNPLSPLANAPTMYCLARLILAATAKLCMLLTNCLGSAPYAA